MHIVADLLHGKNRNDTAKELLNWQPRDRLEPHWLRKLDDVGDDPTGAAAKGNKRLRVRAQVR